MRVIGVTGPVGSGKSLVLDRIKEEFDCEVIRADEVARLLQLPGGECYDSVKKLLGRDCILPDGSFDRNMVAKRIFGDKKLLEAVNAIVHPAVKEHILSQIDGYRSAGRELVFVEAAILLDSGFGDICSEIWNIFVREELRRSRLKSGRGYSDEKTEAILSGQMSPRELEKLCDRTIDNSGSIDETMERIRSILLER